MSEVTSSYVEHATRYLQALEAGVIGDALAAFFTPDVIQEEFPNRLVPSGAQRDLSTLLASAERGQQVMANQTYELVNTVAAGTTVVLEVRWTGTLAVALETLPVGAQMRARFAVVLEYRDGAIARQRNYDCFEPW
jgi:ketosteroid isomerase-like protein